MKQLRLCRASILLAQIVALLALLLPGMVTPARANEGCLPGVGTKVPVLMVHGWRSDKGFWGKTESQGSMARKISEIEGIHYDRNNEEVKNFFDYSADHSRWVSHKNIGPRLVNEINCRAASSKAEGGAGKVILIGHSMGGLAIRYAANNGAKDSIGAVVTIGTPNIGSGWASAGMLSLRHMCRATKLGHAIQAIANESDCNELLSGNSIIDAFDGLERHSDELAALPMVPDSIPVTGIAGNVGIQHTWGIFGSKIFTTHLGSDLVVTTASALRGSQTHEVHCEAKVAFTASCMHTNMKRDQQVQQHVLDAITRYISEIEEQQRRKLDPCYGQPGTCLGKREGDFDGDGKSDKIALIRSDDLYANVIFGNGEVKAYEIVDQKTVESVLPGTSGFSNWSVVDVNGNGRDDLFVGVKSPKGYLNFLAQRELWNGEFTPTPGLSTNNYPDLGWENGEIYWHASVTCREINGKTQLVTISYSNGDEFGVIERVHEADSSGRLKQIRRRFVKASPSPEGFPGEAKELMGEKCIANNWQKLTN